MDEPIELTLPSPDGTIDCRLDPETQDDRQYYSATILYPHVVNGFSRSDIYCHNFHHDPTTGTYHFEEDTIHPKIKKLEVALSDALIEFLGK